MGTFKKLFASIAAVMIVVSTAPVAVFGQTSWSQEYQDAYAYAYANGITTMSSIDAANLAGTTTRAQAAKMFVEFAKSLGQTADTSASCSFSDLAPIAGTDLAGFAVEACQMGLMGINTNGIFNPNGVLSRAEYGTILSRVLFGDVYNGGNPFYAAHLNALNQAGLMNDLSNPERSIMRGDAFLLLFRASTADLEGVTPGFCSDIETVFACTIDPDGSMGLCPAACIGGETEGEVIEGEETEVKAGNLSLSLASGTPANGASIPSVGTVPFAAIQFSAGAEDVRVHSVTVERFGLGERADIDRLFFERNGVRVSGRASLSSDNTAVISFSPSLIVKKNGSETLDLLASIAGAAGSEHGFRVTAVNSSAVSASFNISTPMLRTSTYTVGSVDFDAQGAPNSVRAGEVDVELGQFRLSNNSNDNKSLVVKSITLRQQETADLKNLSDLAIFREGEKVSTEVTINGKEVSFALNTTLTDGQTPLFYVRGTVNYVDTPGEEYQFTLRNIEDLVAAESTTAFRATVTITDGDLESYDVEGADVMLSRDTSLSTNLQVSPGASNVVIMKGTIKSMEAITLEDLELDITTAANLSLLANKFTLRVGNSTSTWTPANTVGNQTATFDGAFNVNGTVAVQLTVDLRSNAPDSTFSVETLDLVDFDVYEYVASQNEVQAGSIAGSIAGPIVTVTTTRLNAARTDGLSSRSIVQGSSDVVLGKARFTTSDAGSIRLSSLQLQGIAGGSQNNLSVTLYVNGTAVSTRNATSSTVTFSSLPASAVVSSTNVLNIEFRGTFSQTALGANSLVLGAIQATDANGQTVTANPTSLSFGTLTLSTGGAVSFSANAGTPGASLLNGGLTDVEIAKFNINATDDNLRLTDLYLTQAAGSTVDFGQRLSNIQLFDGATAIANGTVVENGTVIAFQNLNGSNIVTTAGNAKSLSVKATVNNVLNSTDVAGTAGIVQLAIGTGAFTAVTAGTANGARFISEANGSVVTPASVGLVISNAHRIVRGLATVAALPTTASQTRVMNFSVTAAGNRVKLQNVAFTLRNVDGTPTVNLYKDSVSAGNLLTGVALVGTSSANTITDVLALGSLAQEIAAGSTANYVIEIVGYTPSESNGGNFLSRQFELNDVHYQDVFNNADVLVTGLNNYVNAGNFAINAPSFNAGN